jgi:nicotinamidase-related amidase
VVAQFQGNSVLNKPQEDFLMKKMLIVVDMLKDFVEDGGALYFEGGAAIVEAVRDRLEAHRELGEDSYVVFVNDAHLEDDKEFDKWPPHAVKGTEGAKVIDYLAPQDGENVMEKTRYSGWFNTNMEIITRIERPEEVEVVGVCTGICVMDTVAGFANRDIPTVIHTNAVADFDQDRHDMCLKRMKEVYGTKLVGDAT